MARSGVSPLLSLAPALVFQPGQRDLAELGDHLGLLRRPAVLFSRRRSSAEDLGGRPAGRPDQEHPVEPALVLRVAGPDGCRDRRVGVADRGLLPRGEFRVVIGAGLLADPRDAGPVRAAISSSVNDAADSPGPVQHRRRRACTGRPASTSSTQRGTSRQVCQGRPGLRRRTCALNRCRPAGCAPSPSGCGWGWTAAAPPPVRTARAPRIGLASATRSSNRWLAILATSMMAAACSWVGAFCIRSQPDLRIWSRFSTSRTETISGMPNRSR